MRWNGYIRSAFLVWLSVTLQACTASESGVDGRGLARDESDASVMSADVMNADASSAPNPYPYTENDDVEAILYETAGEVIPVRYVTCDGDYREALPIPSSWFNDGLQVWHLCYTTQAAEVSPSFAEVLFPESMTFTRRIAGVEEPLVNFTFPRNRSYTASIALAVYPAPDLPLFNLRYVYTSSEELAWGVERDMTMDRLLSRGGLRAWRVSRDGTRTPVALRPLASSCWDYRPQFDDPGGDFFPTDMACPAHLRSCGPGMFHCSD